MARGLKTDGNVYHSLNPIIPSSYPVDQVEDARERALVYASDIRFHRCFQLPPNPAIGRTKTIKVTYSDAGFSPADASPGEEIPVLLWCAGTFGGRYQAVANDKEARRQRVRFIAMDRPGIGGTDMVPLEQRILTWLDMVPALLKHLDIKHVSLAAHSDGTIYVLNTILHQRELLHPEKPFLALFAPWVLPSHSLQPASVILQGFPKPALSSLHHVGRFMIENVAPVFSTSLFQVNKLFLGSPKGTPPDEDNVSSRIELHQAVMQTVLARYILLEQLEGISQEACICFQKGHKLWGEWSDYPEVIAKISANEASRNLSTDSNTESQPTSTSNPIPNPQDPQFVNGNHQHPKPNLTVHCFFGNADELIGTRGKTWFDKCWSPEKRGPAIDFESEYVVDLEHHVSKSDHNDVLRLELGAFVRVMRHVSNNPADGLAEFWT